MDIETLVLANTLNLPKLNTKENSNFQIPNNVFGVFVTIKRSKKTIRISRRYSRMYRILVS